MTQLPTLLDLSIALDPPPVDAASEVLATITLRCDALGISHQGDLLLNPLTQQERDDLHWYLERYPLWPYAEFVTRGKQIEAHLAEIGQRLYRNIFGSPQAAGIVQAWNFQPCEQRQISILSQLPGALSLPWELLHDELGFLAMRTRQPAAIVRYLPQRQLPTLLAPVEPPLRILLVMARPEGTGFFDPRSIARELLDVLQEHIEDGSIALEFLRPPTMYELRERLRDEKKPVHILHFDGHGIFDDTAPTHDEKYKQGGAQGKLAFENNKGQLDLVAADDLAQVLLDSGVKLAVLDACQSAMSSNENVFSSVAARLVQAGIDATVSMSATVLVISTTRFFKAFYQELARNTAVPQAIERARQQLQDDPRRFLFSPNNREEGQPVILRDWWLPHYYQQRPLSLTLNLSKRKSKARQSPSLPRLNKETPAAPRYQFSGRSYELLQIERHLLQDKLVVLSGFGGIGKTALAREAADWLTRSGLYQGACFVSFEHGGDASTLLSALGHYLGIADSAYNPNEPATALISLRTVLKERRILLIADNLESILPGGEAPLPLAARTQLWDALLALAKLHAGILLTSRDTNFGDGRMAPSAQVASLPLQGLLLDDAYELATRLLTNLNIDRAKAPYAELHDLLSQLDDHPLAIQLVLPALRTTPLTRIRTDFATLLPTFVDDQESGRNRSLLASLTYSLQRLSAEQRSLLSSLDLFEGGAAENSLLAVTEIPEQDWLSLRQSLQQASLLVLEQIHEEIVEPLFLRFHPVLIPFLRSQLNADDADLRTRYMQHYYAVANYLYDEDDRHPQPMRALVQKELPNLRHALALLLAEGELDTALTMAECVIRFLNIFGLLRERDELRQLVNAAVAKQQIDQPTELTQARWLHEFSLGNDAFNRGDLRTASTHFAKLLARIEAQPEGTPLGCGSYEHNLALNNLARCFRNAGQPSEAEQLYRQAISIIDALLKKQPENTSLLRQSGVLLGELGTTILIQGNYAQAQRTFEEALKVFKQVNDQRSQATTLVQLGTLAAQQQAYTEAKERYAEALILFHSLDEPEIEAGFWHNLGNIALEQQDWSEAEQCYRTSLAIREQLGLWSLAATTCNQLAIVAENAGRFGEAEGWYKRALGLNKRAHPESADADIAAMLNNFANLLVNEIRASRAGKTRLSEAKRYAEQALEIREQLDASSGIWMTLGVLADIADMENHEEEARAFRRRERETYAAFAGNRYHIDRQHGELITAIATVARGDTRAKDAIEAALSRYEENGWHIVEAIQRIWAGERDWHALTEELNSPSALLILRVLETLAQPMPTPEEVFTALPSTIREALEHEDMAALQQAMEALSEDDQQEVKAALRFLQTQASEDDEEEG